MEDITVNNMKLVSVEWRQTMGKDYAFVTAEDLGSHGEGFTPQHFKKYWGEASKGEWSDIVAVMENGGKWDNLP